MGSCRIIKPGLLTTVQDLGRKGHRYHAIPQSGVMDRQSAILAHRLLANPPSLPLLECTVNGPTLEFLTPATLVITGAPMQWQLNGKVVPENLAFNVGPGDILKSGFARQGLRSYLAIKGRIESEFHFDSASTYAYAGLGHGHGRALQKGQMLSWTETNHKLRHQPALHELTKDTISLVKGPEYDYLTAQSKAALMEQPFIVTPQSNRMGARLATKSLLSSLKTLKNSVPILQGMIQLPPDGMPIVVLQDGQTTGGYPRIAYIPSSELDYFNQIAFNRPFYFKSTS